MSGRPASPEYLGGWLHDRLAEDGLSELGIGVKVTADLVVLTGVVATPERRDDVERAVRDLVPDLRVRNDVVVSEFDEPTVPEAVQ